MKDNCQNDCTEIVENETREPVPFYIYENELARSERTIKRLWIIVIILIGLVAGMVTGFLIYDSLFETVSYSQDGEGINNVNVGEQGDVLNEPDGQNQKATDRKSESGTSAKAA